MANRKPNSLIPANDKKRLEKLYEYSILNTHSEEEFDKIARLAANVFDCPAALITFVDKETVFFKSNLSELDQIVVPRKDSFCSITILDDKVTVIEDASQYEDLMESPFVCNVNGIRFYAGAPLTTSDGFKLGSICVFDGKPRTASDKQLEMLNDLSKLVIDILESRLQNKKLISIQAEYMNRSVHDLNNYVGNLVLASEMLQEATLDNKLKGLPGIIYKNANQLSERMSQMLNLSKIESNAYQLSLSTCDLSSILDEVITNYSTILIGKKQEVIKKYATEIAVHADCKALTEIFENLLSNAIKYSFPGSEITINSNEENDGYVLAFHDNGQGLSGEDIEKIFTRYARISSVPTGKESSNGIGLTITKILVELHDGKIWVESEGKNQGTTFFLYLPKKDVASK